MYASVHRFFIFYLLLQNDIETKLSLFVAINSNSLIFRYFVFFQGQYIKYDGDPLKDFTLIRFLDRFVYKNPKKDLGNVIKSLSYVLLDNFLFFE